MSLPAVFLDKDGTLIENIPYNVDPEQMKFTPNAELGLQLLQQAGYPLIVISNQSGVARGYFSETALIPVIHRLQEMLLQIDVTLTGFYYCPHHPQGVVVSYAIDCDCRKPQAGLFHQAAREHAIDLSRSWFIGDILHDMAAGRAAGCRTVLIDNGNETEWQLSQTSLPHHVVTDLYEAARVILAVDAAYPKSGSKYFHFALDTEL